MLTSRQKFIVVGVALGLAAALALAISVAAGNEAGQNPDDQLAQAADAAEAPRRGCTACHIAGGIDADGKYSLLWEAQERTAAGGEGKQHPAALPGGAPLNFQSGVADCLQCHKPGVDDQVGKGAFAPLSLRDIVHPAHLFSTPFNEEYHGGCFSCHNVANDGTWELLSQKVNANEKGVPSKRPIPGALRPSETW
ncbi:MAG: hypothetical protein M1370_09265 [Bacteroidetes bacterium]|nr:hypothetical protein [Bacteroidota bacterium]MCL5024929.1 hypothetical protein [Chloroflexota bacterium]